MIVSHTLAPMVHARAFIMVLSASFMLGACGSLTPAESRMREEVPDVGRLPPDFAVSATLILPGDVATLGTPAWVRPAWYVVEADGRLRAREGVRTPAATLPPLVRQLRYEDVRELWSTARAGGLIGDANADVVDSVSVASGAQELPRGGVVRPTVALYVSGGGTRRGYLIDISMDDAAAQRTRDLTARLAALAGVGQGEP